MWEDDDTPSYYREFTPELELAVTITIIVAVLVTGLVTYAALKGISLYFGI